MASEIHECIVLCARPAAGKSEVIDYLKKTPPAERVERFRVGRMEEIDDFPILWRDFEDDDIRERHGKERLLTTSDYYFKDEWYWNFLIHRLSLDYQKLLARGEEATRGVTALVEFARGGERAYRDAFDCLGDEVLERAGILFIHVSYEESVRKNRRRARKGQEGSILFHSLPDEKMDYYYKVHDFPEVCPGTEGVTTIRGHRVPYAVLQNEPEVTDDPARLGPALEEVLGRLWRQRLAKRR